jgi:uncharacterized membrane protein
MVSIQDINPFKNFGIDIGTIGFVLLVFFVAILILGLVGVLIFVILNKKRYNKTIPLYKKIGSATLRVAIYKARDYKIGNAGDKLWYVKTVKKYIPPATLQTAPNEYSHFERSDGEWINISLPDIDEKMKRMGVKYIHQDMRANRVAINTLLDLRFTNKSWWEKYGHMIMNVIFYLVVAIAMVIIFYQWSDIVTKTANLLDKIIALEDQRRAGTPEGIIPAISLLLWRFKKKK